MTEAQQQAMGRLINERQRLMNAIARSHDAGLPQHAIELESKLLAVRHRITEFRRELT